MISTQNEPSKATLALQNLWSHIHPESDELGREIKKVNTFSRSVNVTVLEYRMIIINIFFPQRFVLLDANLQPRL